MRSCIELQANAIKHGMENALLIIGPRPGEHTIRTEDVIAKIHEDGDSLATVMMPGINYLTGQVCMNVNNVYSMYTGKISLMFIFKDI